jgi:hypothetical protein
LLHAAYQFQPPFARVARHHHADGELLLRRHLRLDGDDPQAARHDALEVREYLGPGERLALDSGIQKFGAHAHVVVFGPVQNGFISLLVGVQTRQRLLEFAHATVGVMTGAPTVDRGGYQ